MYLCIKKVSNATISKTGSNAFIYQFASKILVK